MKESLSFFSVGRVKVLVKSVINSSFCCSGNFVVCVVVVVACGSSS
jgi:hypothetical protein